MDALIGKIKEFGFLNLISVKDTLNNPHARIVILEAVGGDGDQLALFDIALSDDYRASLASETGIVETHILYAVDEDDTGSLLDNLLHLGILRAITPEDADNDIKKVYIGIYTAGSDKTLLFSFDVNRDLSTWAGLENVYVMIE